VKAHCHDAKSTCLTKDLAFFDECAAVFQNLKVLSCSIGLEEHSQWISPLKSRKVDHRGFDICAFFSFRDF
jgi:hypothetical protein